MDSVTPRRRKSKSKNPKLASSFRFPLEPSPGLFPSKEEIVKLLAVVAIAVFVAVACNFIVRVINPPKKPYCESDESGNFLPGSCEPCPVGGLCNGGKLECLSGYKRHGRYCIQDVKISQTAKKLSKWIEVLVCKSYARVLCGGSGAIWFQEAEILRELDDNSLILDQKNESIMFTKEKVIEAIEGSLETRIVSDGIKEFKCPDVTAEHYRSFGCCIRWWLYRNISFVLLITFMIAPVIKILWRIHKVRCLSNRAEELYEQVCDILEENAMMAKEKPGVEPWVVSSQLRDHLLLPRERRNALLWKKVEELIQEDSRLDQFPKLIKGESKTVWEWQVEGSLSSGTKRIKKAVNKMKRSDLTSESSTSSNQFKFQKSELTQ